MGRVLNKKTNKVSSSGFTLIEILMVLGVIGVLFSAILPSLTLTSSSQMSIALRDFSAAVRASYDGAVLNGKVHRLVLGLKSGEYWTEAAPEGFADRPPPPQWADNSVSENNKIEDRAKFLEQLEALGKDPRKSTDHNDHTYVIRSIVYQQRNKLTPLKWFEVDDSLLFKRKLPGDVGFVSVASQMRPEKIESLKAEPKQTEMIYFFPSGEAIQTAVQLGILKTPTEWDDKGPKFTIVVDPISGRSDILEGLEDVEFVKSQQSSF